jgi:hypothetical protein
MFNSSPGEMPHRPFPERVCFLTRRWHPAIFMKGTVPADKWHGRYRASRQHFIFRVNFP